MRLVWNLLCLFCLSTFVASDKSFLKIPVGTGTGSAETEALIDDILLSTGDSKNIVIINTQKHNLPMSELNHQNNRNELIPLIYLQVDELMNMSVSKIVEACRKENKESLYLIKLSQNANDEIMTTLVKVIKEKDYHSKIAVISNADGTLKNKALSDQLYDVTIVIPNFYYTKFTMYGICRFCNDGLDGISQQNIWRTGTGFELTLEFLPSFTGTFHGATVRMGTPLFFPNIYVVGKYDNGTEMYDGYVYRNYEIIGYFLNVRWKFLPPRDGNMWFLPSYFKDLHEGYTDILGGGWIGNHYQYIGADFTATTLYYEGVRIISVEPFKGLRWSAIVEPFDIVTWILILACIPIFSCVIYFFNKIKEEQERRMNFSDAFWIISTVICWDSINISKPSLGTVMAMATWISMSFILVTGYTGVYTALIAATKYLHPPIETLAQLENTDMKIVACDDYMKNDLNYRLENLPKLLHRYELSCIGPEGQNPFVNALNTTFNDPDNLVMLNFKEPSLIYIREHSLETGDRKFYFSKNTLNSQYGNMFFRHNCYFKEAMNQKITLFQDMGFNQNNVRQIDIETKVHIKAEFKNVQLDVEKPYLKLKNMLGGFTLLGIGYVSALICHVMERIIHVVLKYDQTRISNSKKKFY